jgi:CubicO group peptidase (beta-lactamase class C family)
MHLGHGAGVIRALQAAAGKGVVACVNLGGSLFDFLHNAAAAAAGRPCWHGSGNDLGLMDTSGAWQKGRTAMRHWVALWLASCVLAGPRVAAGEPVYPGRSWEIRGPREVGLNGARLDQFAARVGGAGCIVKDGYLVKSWGEATLKRDWASAAKPVLSTLLLFAVAEGRLPSVDARVADLGWDLQPKDRTMTFRHLANMVSGYGRAEPPGAAWAYNDCAISLYARSLEKVFGASLDAALRERLAPLQFEDGSIFSSRDGRGVATTPRDFARIGWFWLNRGNWKGQALLPRELFDACVKPGVPADLPRTQTPGEEYLGVGSYGGGTDQTPYGPGVYGFNWWFNEPVRPGGERGWPAAPADTFQANGMWNRDVVTVIPSLRMMIAFCGGSLGKFEPGAVASEANENMKLLVEATMPGQACLTLRRPGARG